MAVAEPVAIRSQSEEAYQRILERIVSLEMPPGSVVNEARLREELKIGRTPIREALQRLARENLVRSIPHRGTFITDVNITDLARITEVRVVLDSSKRPWSATSTSACACGTWCSTVRCACARRWVSTSSCSRRCSPGTETAPRTSCGGT